MTIAIEDITVERVQHNPDPSLGRCDICKQGGVAWEVDFGWKRRFPYQVPLSVSHAYLCQSCHANEPGTLEFIRNYFEKQATYRS